MLNLFPAAAACAVLASSLASAGTIYKCTVDGKLSYGDRPCLGGAATELAVAPTPAPDPDTAARLARQRIMAMHLTERDVANEQRAERAREREQRSRAARQLKCDRLRLRQQWAQDDLRHAGAKGSEAARTKAQRHAQTVALECAS
jgi:hypothetical protein